MKRLAVLPFAALLILAAPAQAQTLPVFERFQMWDECQPMYLVVVGLNNAAADIGLKKEDISVAARSRLRAARLYTEESPLSYLYINVNVMGPAFSIDVKYYKWLIDTTSGEMGPAATWDTGSTGTHGGDAGFVLSAVSRYTDSFIDEYLRVNEAACTR